MFIFSTPTILRHAGTEQVSFRYAPDAPPALERVAFQIPAGSFVGIVGRSGSGKSTLVRLLLGLHRPQEGLIRLDGRDLREIDVAYLRGQIAIVLQDSFLMRGTIRDTIAVSRPDGTIYDAKYLDTLRRLSDEVFLLPGVDRARMRSLWTPSTRWVASMLPMRATTSSA